MSKKKITMKLLIDKNKRKVLFAEAGKETVDFLFHTLTLPLGTVVSILSKESMAGSVGNLYGSLEALDADYVRHKDRLLLPKSPLGVAREIPLLTAVNGGADLPAKNPNSVTFYGCNAHMNVCDGLGATCPECKKPMSHVLTYLLPEDKAGSGDGYVKGAVTYMIADDLSVQPMSMISTIMALNRFGVEHVGGLEEMEVILDINVAVTLLRALLMSKTVLADVFMSKKVVC